MVVGTLYDGDGDIMMIGGGRLRLVEITILLHPPSSMKVMMMVGSLYDGDGDMMIC